LLRGESLLVDRLKDDEDALAVERRDRLVEDNRVAMHQALKRRRHGSQRSRL
jgi:hypothetical protein